MTRTERPRTDGGESTPQRIDSCTTIESSGTYVLTRDLRNEQGDACIEIRADDVTFDGRGYTIDGVDAENSDGVRVDGASNVTVRNLVVTDWDDGISLRHAPDAVVTDVTARGNQVGVVAGSRSAGAEIRTSTASGNHGDGFYVVDANAVRVNDVEARNNARHGINVGEFSARTRVSDSRSVGNGGDGVHLLESSALTVEDTVAANNEQNGIWTLEVGRQTLTGNEVRGNGLHGVLVRDSNDVDVIESEIRENEGDGVRFHSSFAPGDEASHTLRGSTIIDNGDAGLRVVDSDENVVRGNDFDDNGLGVVVETSEGVEIRDNRIGENFDHGVRLVRSENVTVANNRIFGNQNDGVAVRASNGSRIMENSITGSADNGVDVSGGRENRVDGGTVANNGGDGVYVRDRATGTVVRNVDVRNNGDDGVHVHGSVRTTLADLTVCGNGDSQVVVERSTETVRRGVDARPTC